MPVLDRERDYATKELPTWKASPDHRREEVWDGVTVIMPEADLLHNDLDGFIYRIFFALFAEDYRHRVYHRLNLSDREEGWTQNYRNPDMALFLETNPAKDCGTHMCGGPDFALEVMSPGDRSREKLGFYAAIRTREVLLLDRNPWSLELFRFEGNEMRLAGQVVPDDGQILASAVVPIGFALIQSAPRPKVKIVHNETGQEWVR